MSATVEKYDYYTIIGLIKLANIPGATSIPHYALSLETPGEYALAMWSNIVINDEIDDIGEDICTNDDGDFDFSSFVDIIDIDEFVDD